MDLAAFIMSGMPRNSIWPNVVTYSTVIDGYASRTPRCGTGIIPRDEVCWH